MNVNDILNNINQIAEKLFKSVEGEVFTTLDKIVDITPDIMTSEPLKTFIAKDGISGMIVIVNAMLFFYGILYAFHLLLSLYNGNKVENVYLFVIKMVIIIVMIQNSYFICQTILELNHLLCDAISKFGQEMVKQQINFTNLKEKIISIQDFLSQDVLSLNGLIKGVISFGAITILIHFSVRYVTVIFLVLLFPLALSTLLSNMTSGIFKSYFKLLMTALLTQTIVKFILIIPLLYQDVNSVLYKIILVGSIFMVYRLNMFVKELLVKMTEEGKEGNIFRRGR